MPILQKRKESQKMAKKKAKKYTEEELWRPQIDLSANAAAYARQSTKEQYIENVESHISQTVGILKEAKAVGFRDDGTTGVVTLFVENQVIDEDGNTQIKNASGTWPIDRRPDLKAILDLIEEDKIKLVIVEFVDRLFRDEDRIDSNIFIKACKEHDCFVYVTSKKLIYNFANPQMADMFRTEVAFAAAYIQHHVKDVMIKRRDQAVEKGQYGGGYIPMGFIVCKDEKSKYYKHLIPYDLHADVVVETGIKILKMGMDAFCKQAMKTPVFFPDFEEEDQAGHRSMTKVEGGYIITTRTGLIDMVLNPANIGIMEYGENIRAENAHLPIMDREIYDLLYTQLKGGERRGRYYQRKSSVERIGTLKKLLASSDNRCCTYAKGESTKKGEPYYYYYYQLTLYQLMQNSYSINADEIETIVENRLLEHLQEYDLGDLSEELNKAKRRKQKDIQDIDTQLSAIAEETATLTENLKKAKAQILIDSINTQAAKLEVRAEGLRARKATLKKELEEEEEDLSIEAELARLNITEIPPTIRQSILEFLVRKVLFDRMSTRYFRIQIVWKVPEWDIDTIYIDRKDCTYVHWTEEELNILADIYPRGSHEDILEALPHRSWRAITVRASKTKVRRKGYMKLNSLDDGLSWSDLMFLMDQKNINFGKWAKTP